MMYVLLVCFFATTLQAMEKPTPKPIAPLKELALEKYLTRELPFEKTADEIISEIKKAPRDLHPDLLTKVFSHPYISFADKRKIVTAVQPEVEKILTDKKMKVKEKIQRLQSLIPITTSLALYIFLHPQIPYAHKEKLLSEIKRLAPADDTEKNVIAFLQEILETHWATLTPKKLEAEGINIKIPVNRTSQSLIFNAFSTKKMHAAGALLKHGAQFTQQELQRADVQQELHDLLMQSIQKDDLFRVQLLIDAGATKKSQIAWNKQEFIANIENNPLYKALTTGKHTIAEAMLDKGLYDLDSKIIFTMGQPITLRKQLKMILDQTHIIKQGTQDPQMKKRTETLIQDLEKAISLVEKYMKS